MVAWWRSIIVHPFAQKQQRSTVHETGEANDQRQR